MTLFCPTKNLLALAYGALDTSLAQACFVSIGYADPIYGAGDDISNTSIVPDTLSDGTRFSGLYWQADGLFYATFGDTGSDEIDGVNRIIISSIGGDNNLLLTWEAANNRYKTTNQKLAGELIDQYNANGKLEDMCFGLYPLVSRVIKYDSFAICDCDVCDLPEFVIYYDNYEINCWSKG